MVSLLDTQVHLFCLVSFSFFSPVYMFFPIFPNTRFVVAVVVSFFRLVFFRVPASFLPSRILTEPTTAYTFREKRGLIV